MLLTYEDLKAKRKAIINNVRHLKVVNKGIETTHSNRVCSICGKHLNKYDFNKKRFIVTNQHYHYSINGVLEGSMCLRPSRCWKYYQDHRM